MKISSCLLPATMSTSQRSLFVTLAAQAMSSVGFSVSIIAWIWLTLVPPPKIDLTEPILVDKKARRRSAPAALQSRKRDSLSPSANPPSPDALSPISPRTRRVYFVDSPTSSLSRPTNQFERTPHDSLLLEKPLHASPTSETSPLSSSSTLVHTYPGIPPQTLETCRESAIESDSSNNCSPRTSLSSSRPSLPPRNRRNSGTSIITDVSPMASEPAETTHRRRSSIGFTPPWSFRRASGSRNPASPATSSTNPTLIPAPSYFTRKTARRVSTPVPRTQPYAYPYYAQPPIEDEAYAAHLRSLPQFGPEVANPSPSTSDSEEKEKESPLLDRRSRNRKAQAALGLGRQPPAVRPHQRSASESWAAGKEPRL
ncbi:hypothetical protein B0H11DRAFT_2084523 [Mycena galericulata]|nr:hypothetical protein B0H11DRAFT_2084523 [Mycena galericulata]